MKKTLQLLQTEFQSSSGLTPQFKTFAMTFKREFTALLTSKGCTKVEVNRGHFYLYGFFTAPDNQIYYFNFGDVRWPMGEKTRILYRTANHYKDWTGGFNQYSTLENFGRLGILDNRNTYMQKLSQ